MQVHIILGPTPNILTSYLVRLAKNRQMAKNRRKGAVHWRVKVTHIEASKDAIYSTIFVLNTSKLYFRIELQVMNLIVNHTGFDPDRLNINNSSQTITMFFKDSSHLKI